jgi:hypothetical protein
MLLYLMLLFQSFVDLRREKEKKELKEWGPPAIYHLLGVLVFWGAS